MTGLSEWCKAVFAGKLKWQTLVHLVCANGTKTVAKRLVNCWREIEPPLLLANVFTSLLNCL